MFVLEQLDKRLIDFLIDHAVNQDICSFFNGSARGFQLGRVNCHANFVGVAFLNRGPNNRPKTFDRMVFVDDVPDLDVVRVLRREFPHKIPRLLGPIGVEPSVDLSVYDEIAEGR